MTRIIAGRAGGRTLRVPAGSATRPTSDRVREALFSRLEHEWDFDGLRVLDLFAGSGALGLEAASRGAAHVLLVDSSRHAVAACRANASALRLPVRVDVDPRPVEHALADGPPVHGEVADADAAADDEHVASSAPAGIDLAFLDPPYDLPEAELAAVLGLLVEREWLKVRAMVVVERSTRSPEPTWPAGLVRTDARRYGETTLWFADAE